MTDLVTARLAGQLAAQIDALQRAIDDLAAAKEGGFLITGVTAVNPQTNSEVTLYRGKLDSERSASALDVINGIYEARMAELMAQLEAL